MASMRSQSWFVALVTASLGAPALAQTVDELVARLARAAAYEDEHIGEGEPSTVYPDYALLAVRASTAQLVALAAHESPIVRCYAVRALAERGDTKELPAILRAHRADVTPLDMRSGCELAHTRAGDVMFDVARPKLDAAALLDLAELYVREASPLDARAWCLRTLRFRDGMLHTIRKLAADGDATAAVALARFGLAADVPLLIEHVRRPEPFEDPMRFWAAEISRDPRLLPALAEVASAARKRLQNDNPYRLRAWLQAITAQGSDDAARVLAEFVADPGVTGARALELRKTVVEAIEAHPAAPFAELRQQLGERDRK